MTFTIKEIESRLRVDHESAIKLRNLLRGKLDPLTFKKAAQYDRQCYCPPSKEMLMLYAADEILETCGIEGITVGSDEHCYSYCNAGDSYATTLVLDHETNEFMITTWGDLVEDQSKDNYEETLEWIESEGHGSVKEGAPTDWPKQVFGWLWNNEQEELEEGSNLESATPSSESIKRALQDLGLFDQDSEE